MLTTKTALSSIRCSVRVRCPRPVHRNGLGFASRTLFSSTIQGLTNEFLDLAIALPIPPSLPPYSTTIILVTVVTRLAITVPFSVWAKKRAWKAENIVAPQLQQGVSQIHKTVLQDMKSDGFRGERDAVIAESSKRVKAEMKTRRAELFALHRCSPIPTLLAPAVSQLPLFVGLSMMMSRASQAPTVFDSESFMTLTSLAHPDPTVTLPIVLGLITLANVESSRWFLSAGALEREKKVAKWTADRRARGEAVIEPKKIIQTSLRILSISRILIAAVVPGSIQIYWVTSAAFGLVQSWILDWWDARRTQRYLKSQPASSTKPPAV